MPPKNLVNLERVSKSYGRAPLLDKVSLGVSAGDRLGVVGRNGAGKSTLLKVITGEEDADSGRVTRSSGVRIGYMTQLEDANPDHSIRDRVLGDQADHEWATEAQTRDVLEELLGGFEDERLARTLGSLSGGERRRVELARLLIQDLDLLILDEPTNHLDIEAVAWLADFLKSQRRLALVVVTHDRWLLDELSQQTWEVVHGQVEKYEGGYSAFVLAKAERARQAEAESDRRNNLIRKELAWLRRGPPARTSKPKFRIDTANELIEREPPPRDSVELLSFANSRLGKTVWDLHDVSLSRGEHEVLRRVDWNVGPGDRIAIVGVNGAGKTSLVRMLLAELRPASGKIVRGKTIKPAYLSQHLEELNPTWRVLEAVEHVALHATLAKGRQVSASQLCERLGFDPEAQWTPVGDLSGGERRRLQLTRLLMGEPNVLVLDEPTNDFDVETLTALEDLLDSFAGTLLVITHDRYFAERVCDGAVGLLGDGKVRDLPGGVDEYLALRRERRAGGQTGSRGSRSSQARTPGHSGTSGASETGSGGAGIAGGSAVETGVGEPSARPTLTAKQERELRKQMTRAERRIARADAEESRLHDAMTTHAADFAKIGELDETLRALQADRSVAEEEWLAAAEAIEADSA